MERYLYSELANLVQAHRNCIAANNQELAIKHNLRILKLIREYMPSGSGWDCGTKFDYDASHANKFVFHGSFHHMNEDGYYDGWTKHTIVATPSMLYKIDIRITGRNRNDIKDHLHEMFHIALTQTISDEEENHYES